MSDLQAKIIEETVEDLILDIEIDPKVKEVLEAGESLEKENREFIEHVEPLINILTMELTEEAAKTWNKIKRKLALHLFGLGVECLGECTPEDWRSFNWVDEVKNPIGWCNPVIYELIRLNYGSELIGDILEL